jgi:hypothetical protein
VAKLIFIGFVLWAGWMLLRPKPKARVGASTSASPDEKEARAVLGVSATADADAIRAAHRKLVAAVHPDVGGSAELTRRVNAARDVLLK